MQKQTFQILIQELCSEMKIKMEILSYGWILQLSKDGKVRHIAGNRFDINPEATGNIACDKYATYEVLNSQNIPVIEHTMMFNPTIRGDYISDEGTWRIPFEIFNKYKKVVVKPNNGAEGIGVSLCNTMKELENAIENLFKTNGSISLCPYYDIKSEYRTFYLNGEIHLIYSKTKPYVIGDGYSSVETLVRKLDLPNKKRVIDNMNFVDITYIPKKGEKIEISWKHNLSGGATLTILEKGKLYEKIEKLAKRAGKAMNIRFATIDIIETTDDQLLVMEVNSGIGATIFIDKIEGGYEKIKNIFRKALEILFE